MPAVAAADAPELRAWNASDGAGGGAAGLPRPLSWALLDELEADVLDVDPVGGAFPVVFVLDVSQ